MYTQSKIKAGVVTINHLSAILHVFKNWITKKKCSQTSARQKQKLYKMALTETKFKQ